MVKNPLRSTWEAGLWNGLRQEGQSLKEATRRSQRRRQRADSRLTPRPSAGRAPRPAEAAARRRRCPGKAGAGPAPARPRRAPRGEAAPRSHGGAGRPRGPSAAGGRAEDVPAEVGTRGRVRERPRASCRGSRPAGLRERLPRAPPKLGAADRGGLRRGLLAQRRRRGPAPGARCGPGPHPPTPGGGAGALGKAGARGARHRCPAAPAPSVCSVRVEGSSLLREGR